MPFLPFSLYSSIYCRKVQGTFFLKFALFFFKNADTLRNIAKNSEGIFEGKICPHTTKREALTASP